MRVEPFRRRETCLHCGKVHLPGTFCGPSAPSLFFASLNLPPGKTCGDCVHIARCMTMFGHIEADETCDWYPIRYSPKEAL